MTDAEILDQIFALRLKLQESLEPVDVEDHAQIMLQAAFYVAGVDALLAMRQASD